MDILTLFLLYYLSQNPKLLESMKPIAQMLQASDQSLKALEGFKAFLTLFDGLNPDAKTESTKSPAPEGAKTEDLGGNKNQQSPFQGIADELLQQYLDEYLKNG